MPELLRRAAVAGSWYPGTADRIRAEVGGYLAAVADPRITHRVVGLISPHAGLRYSGPVAAELIPNYRLAPEVRVANASRAMDAILRM